MKKNLLSDRIKNLVSNEVFIAFIVFILVSIFIAIITGFWEVISSNIFPNTTWGLYSKSFFENVLAEAHGMLFDILVIGILLLWLYKKVEDKREIKRYHEEIDDFRGWDEKEAKFRIMGIIKRLQRKNCYSIDLSNCYLVQSDITNMQFKNSKFVKVKMNKSNIEKSRFFKSNFNHADLNYTIISNSEFKTKIKFRNASFIEVSIFGGLEGNLNEHNPISIFEDADFWKANFNHAHISNTTFISSYFQDAKFIGNDTEIIFVEFINSNLCKTNFINTIFKNVNFKNCLFIETIFEDTSLKGVNFEDCILRDVDFRTSTDLTMEQLQNAKSLYNCKLDKKLKYKLKRQSPHLFEEPPKIVGLINNELV